ncbi:helix-turn-helix domain-containing protein [Clostridium saccharoperbutylacetonicum]|uniref:helix-turn-helix domain-containing protein n=1 Tax=Clostridium saccharoperbutylacetonicum TaxID=36745 RepID=UPI0039E7B9DD
MEDLKLKIKYYREKQHMSKSELSSKADISPGYITKLENGTKRNPSILVLIRLANALGISINDLKFTSEAFDFNANLNKVDFNYIRMLNFEFLDFPQFLDSEEFKRKIDNYWKSVVKLHPLNEFKSLKSCKIEGTELKYAEIRELSNFLKISFELKINEIKSRKK